MATRGGRTAKLSISLDREDVKALRARARRLHDGNLSRTIAELAADARLLEGMHRLVTLLGGPSLTDEQRAALDRELAGEMPPRRRARGKTAA
jgi:hypothetical protein